MRRGSFSVRFVLTLLSLLTLCGVAVARQDTEYQLKVSVSDRDGNKVEGATVVATPQGAGGIAALTPSKKITDADGHAEFTFGTKGTYSVKVSHPKFDAATATIAVNNAKFAANLQFKLRRKSDDPYKLVVRVMSRMDPEGGPIPGATVSISGLADRTGTTGADGLATFMLPYKGSYRIEVSHPNFGSVTRPVSITSRDAPAQEKFIFTAKGSVMQILVRVTDERGEPLIGAHAVIDTELADHVDTDLTGVAAFRFGHREELHVRSKPYTITVSHPDYDTGTVQVTPLKGGQDRTYEASLQLTRKSGLHRVIIHLVEDGTNAPVMGVRVVLEGGISDTYSGTSEGDGTVSITVRKPTIFRLSMNPTYYEPVADTIDMVGESGTIERTYELKHKKGIGENFRLVRVKVRATTKAGARIPMANAFVSLSSGQGGSTDAEGNIDFLHASPPGEPLSGTAEPKVTGYKKGSASIIPGIHGVMFDQRTFEHYQFLKDWRAGTPMAALTGDFVSNFQKAFGTTATDILVINCPRDFDEPHLDGNVIPNKGRVKVGDTVNVDVAILYAGGEKDEVQIDETVELWGPGKKLVTNNVSRRMLTVDKYSRRYFNIVSAEPGIYTVKAHAKGVGLAWSGSASFTVVGTASAPAGPTAGVFRLKAQGGKVLGHVPGSDETPSGTWSGSIGESSLTINFESKPPDDGHGSWTGNWSTPPATIKPGDTIELTCTASASVTGKDRPNLGLSVGWEASGSCNMIEGKNGFAGIASNGTFYGTGEGKYKVKIGSGGSFTLTSVRGGINYGSGGNFCPCSYTYEYVADGAAATTQKPAKTTMTGG